MILKTKNFQINNVETILFDKDGTLIDLHYFWGKMTELRALEVIKKYKLNESNFNQLCTFLGYDINSEKMLPDGITALYSRSKIIEIFKQNLVDININTTIKELENIFNKVSDDFYKNLIKYVKPIESAINFVRYAHSKGLKLGIVTADSIISTNLTLKEFDWEKYFDVVIARESHPDTKESGKPTILALEKLNANPKSTIMIGDTPMDYLSAKNAQIPCTILVSTGQIKFKDLKKTSDYCIKSLNEITIF